jgi:5-methylcytosine-specific restriction protein A
VNADNYGNRKKLYKTKAWYRLRTKQLLKEPCCRYCDGVGHVVMATIVDHIIPHKGDVDLFHDPDNLQSLCKVHHDSTKQREEKTGVIIGGKENGYPVDPAHHWN